MIKELYQEITREVCLNVSAGRVDSVRRKNITKSGCRVYEDGCIGVSGCLGEPTQEVWELARQELARKLASPGPETGKTRSRDLREEQLTEEEFIAATEALLSALKEEFPDFALSNKVWMAETEMRLKNDAGLDYVDIDRKYVVALIVKEAGSPNVWDSILTFDGRRFDREGWLEQSRQLLAAHRNRLPMPEGKEQVVLDSANGMALQGFGILDKALSGRDYHVGTSLFQGKLGEKLFDERVTIRRDISGRDFVGGRFFDMEGTTLPGDQVSFIENGVLRNLVTDKKYAGLLGMESTGCAESEYDGAPALWYSSFLAAPTGQTVSELTRGRDCIYPVIVGGGSWTDEGNYASPVQCAYLCRDGKLVGRLPEFSIAVKLDELFGNRFVGVSTDRFRGSRILAFKATIL